MSYNSRFARRFLAASLESQTEEDEPLVVDPIETVNPENVEAANNDMQQTETDVDGVNDAMIEAEDDSEALIDTANVLRETVEDGEGADPMTARAAEITVESIFQKYGFSKKHAFTSMESFSNRSTRKQTTVLAIEEIENKANRLQDGIKNLFGRLKETLGGFFKAMFVTSERLRQRAEKIKAAASQTQDQGAKTIKINAPLIMLASNQKVTEDQMLKSSQGMLQYAQKSNEMISAMSSLFQETGNSMLGFISNPDKVESFTLPPVVNKLFSGFSETAIPSKGVFERFTPDELTRWYLFDKAGKITESRVYMRLPAPGVKGIAALAALEETQVIFGDLESTMVDGGASELKIIGKEIKALSVKNCQQLCDLVIQTMNFVDQMKGTVKQINSSFDASINALKAFSKAYEGDDTKRAKAVSKHAAKVTRVLGTATSNLAVQTMRNVTNSAHASLEWVRLSLAAHGGKETTPEAN